VNPLLRVPTAAPRSMPAPRRNRAFENITVGYLRAEKESFISNLTIPRDFLDALSRYVRVVSVPADPRKMDLRLFAPHKIDFLLVDFLNFGVKPFLLREIQKIDIPFILILHTVHSWFFELVYSLPLIRKEDVLIAPSLYSRNSFRKISVKHPVHHIPYCLDLHRIQPALSGKRKGKKKKIGYMGRLTEEKGIGVLIDCLPQIIDRVGEVRLKIIGPLSGDRLSDHPRSPYVKELEKKTGQLGLEKHIQFMGVCRGSKKYRLLSELDIFVLPTTAREENSPVSILEALSAGTPVITTDWAGMKEIIRQGRNGYRIPVRLSEDGNLRFDKRHLVHLVEKCLKNGKALSAMRKRARDTALARDFRDVMPRLTALLRKRDKAALRPGGGWNAFRDKTVLDFEDLFREEVLFFLHLFGMARTTYHDLQSATERDAKLPLPEIRKEKRGMPQPLSPALIRKIDTELFRYLCLG
jgi:glycosyltransferase involved in cell wall biosynthesis